MSEGPFPDGLHSLLEKWQLQWLILQALFSLSILAFALGIMDGNAWFSLLARNLRRAVAHSHL